MEVSSQWFFWTEG